MEETLVRLGKQFPLKPESFRPPRSYLDWKISKLEIHNGVMTWIIGAIYTYIYIYQALKNLESILDKHS